MYKLKNRLYSQLLLIKKDAVQVNETLSRAGAMIEQWTGPAVQKESLKVFFLVLQVCHYLTAGQVCSSLIVDCFRRAM